LAEPDDLLGLAFTAAHDPGTAERPRLPVVGAAIPGDEDRMIIDGEPHGSVLAPPQLENVPGAHALYVRGRSMEPRYFSGELVYVDPQRRPNPGDFVLAVVREPNYSAPVGYVRRYLGERTGEFRLGTLQPKREYLIGRDALVRMHPIVGSSLL
jgi:phage repressor protein C with HTH and peptisase S24 domain